MGGEAKKLIGYRRNYFRANRLFSRFVRLAREMLVVVPSKEKMQGFNGKIMIMIIVIYVKFL